MSGGDAPSRASAAADSLRLFLALELPEEHRRAIERRGADLRSRLPPARWVPVENLHLTLAFLGATDPERVPALAAAVAPAFAAVPRFETALVGAGTFPPARPARVAWVGLRPSPELSSLQRAVAASAARSLGLDPAELDRRPFHPHVTVARPRRPWNRRACEDFARAFEPAPGGGAAAASQSFEVEEGVLYRSEPGSSGARYVALERFALGPARAGRDGGGPAA